MYKKAKQTQFSGGVRERQQQITISEKIILKSSLNCLHLVLRHKPTGLALHGLIPSAGTIVFPFLASEDDDIVTTSLETIKSMILIDCDEL